MPVRPSDLKDAAEQIVQEHRDRKSRRKDKEILWDEIDRQLDMRPDLSFKQDKYGKTIPSMAWMPEVELPLQAEALETIVDDAMRLTLPAEGSWYNANAYLTQQYVDRLKQTGFDQITFDTDLEPVNGIDADLVNKIAEAFGGHWRQFYRFSEHVKQIHTEGIKRGVAVGRLKMVRVMDRMVPVLIPKSLKNTYLDDTKHARFNEGIVVGPSVIDNYWMSLKDIQVAAAKGKTSRTDPQGGWLPNNTTRIEAGEKGQVEVLEWEGDLILKRKTRSSELIEDVCLTVVVGKADASVVRYRENVKRSYIYQPYLQEDVHCAYGVSPLMKGAKLHKAAVDALTQLIAAGHLNVNPPKSYNPADPYFAGTDGPQTYPGANWRSMSGVKPQQIGDPAALLAVYQHLLQQYSDVTGVSAPRLGAQTLSHTTAFAKDAEISRGLLRTVEYVRSFSTGFLTEFLQREFEMGKEAMKRNETVMIPKHGAVTIQKAHLPDEVQFEIQGASGPQDDFALIQRKQAALVAAINLEVPKRQLEPQARPLDIEQIQRFLIEEEWPSAEPFFTPASPGVSGGSPGAPTVPGVAPENLPALFQQVAGN